MLFPREDAQAILNWYVRLRVGLREVERLKQTLENAAGAVDGGADGTISRAQAQTPFDPDADGESWKC
jgi:hypothetical protein